MSNAPKKYDRKKIFWTIASIVGIIILVATVARKKAADAREVLITILPLSEGIMLLNNTDVEKILEKSFGHDLKGEPIKSLEVERIESVLEDEPFVKDAEVFVDAKNQIQIKITQREPIVRIIGANNTNYYLDSTGIKMPLSKHYSARVLVATGNIPPYLADFRTRSNYALADLFYLVQYIHNDDFLEPMVEQIYVDRVGEYTLIPKIGGQKIQLGTCKDLEQKIYNLKEFYRQAMPTEGWKKYKTLIIKYKNQIVGRIDD